MFLPGRDAPQTPSTVSPRGPGSLPSTTQLGIFYALQILGGQMGFPVVLFIIAIRRTTLPGIRHPVSLNFYGTWVISSFSFCLLLYTGTQSDPQEFPGLCKTQAILVYIVPVLTSSALWAIVFHLWLSVHCVLQNKGLHRQYNVWLVALPYLLSIGYAVYPTVLAIRQPASVGLARAGFYCAFYDKGPSIFVSITILFLLFVTVVFEILVGIKLWKNRSSFKSVRIQGWISVQLLARLGVFQVYALLVLVTCVEAIIAPERLERIFFQASLPTAAFLAFGTRPGLFQDGTTTLHEGRNGPCQGLRHSTSPTIIGEQPEISPPRSQVRSAIRVWSLWAPLRVDPNKSQIPSGASSRDPCTLHCSIKGGKIKGPILNAIPPSPLDESSKSQDFPSTFNTLPIPLSPTIGEQDHHNIQPITHRMSENRPICRLPTPPCVGQVPVYGQKERGTHHHASTNEISGGKRVSIQSAVSVATLIKVHTETAYHYDPPLTDSSSIIHRTNKSVAAMNSPD